MTTIDIIPVTGPPHALVRESRPEQDQRCFIVLDLRVLTFSVEIDPEPWNNAVSSEAYYGYQRRYNIPPMQPATVNALMEKMLPIAEKVADGAFTVFDRVSARHRYRLNTSARNADAALEAMAEQVECDVHFWADPADYVDYESGHILHMLESGVSVDEVYHLLQGDGSDDEHYYVIGLYKKLERMAADMGGQAPLRIAADDS